MTSGSASVAGNVSAQRLQVGLDVCSVNDIRASIHAAANSGFYFICLPLVHPRFQREFIKGKSKNRKDPLTRADIVTYSADWSNWVVGKLSTYVDVDASEPSVRKQAEEALSQELYLASHLGVAAIQVELHGTNHTNLARIINNKLLTGFNYQVWAHVPMESPWVSSATYIDDNGNEMEQAKSDDPWNWWNTFRSTCNFEEKLGVALEMSADIPSAGALARWAGEPVRCLVVPTTIFISNKRGYPVLSRGHQMVFRSLLRNAAMQVVIKGAVRHGAVRFYVQYMEHLFQLSDDPYQQYARGYEDFLQCPLQPLMDNLESSTYEVFESDPVKYKEYKEAVFRALTDRIPERDKDSTVFVVMIVGAGRGPLVRACLGAATQANRRIKVYAIDKNPGAIVTLQAQQMELWGDLVTVVSTDMREWNAPEKADILVSELLGSFADNELSPECLDGAQKFLKADGISIPSSYTSYVCPIQSSKLWCETRRGRLPDKYFLHHLETAYVVHQQNKFNLAPAQPLFTFHHPNLDEPMDNNRHGKLRFEAREDGVLHGLAGFFDTVLYKDVTLSILPETHSKGMCSWFPIFFPIYVPIPLKKGEILEVHFWRCSNPKNVWYEWCITSPVCTPIHNPNGRSYSIGL